MVGTVELSKTGGSEPVSDKWETRAMRMEARWRMASCSAIGEARPTGGPTGHPHVTSQPIDSFGAMGIRPHVGARSPISGYGVAHICGNVGGLSV